MKTQAMPEPISSRNQPGGESESPRLLSIALAAIGEQLSEQALKTDQRLLPLLQATSSTALYGGWRAALKHAAEFPAMRDQTMFALARRHNFSVLELLTLALTVSTECDLEISRLVAYLQEPIRASRPTVGLVTRAFVTQHDEARSIGLLVQGPAVLSGLLVVAESSAPLPERILNVPLPLVLALCDQPSSWPGSTAGLAKEQRIPFPPSEEFRTRQQARTLASSGERRMVVRAGNLLEAKTAAAIFAEELDLRPLFLTEAPSAGLGPWLLLRGMLPVHCMELGIGERRAFPHIAGYSGPALAVVGVEGELETESGPVLSWKLGVPPPDERELLWRAHVHEQKIAAELASQYRLRAGRIFDLARLARHEAALENRKEVEARDVYRAARSGQAAGLGSLAELIVADVPDEALIVSPHLRKELETLRFRCGSRESLANNLGISLQTRYRPSVQALFVGPSGTGKTLAALWLASRLGLPLYRVDLAATTSKYIGETEKNLSHLLSRAEQAGVVLLFDEADSIFGRRTDIKDSNDRFANSQTNYLLQRMESFDGIMLLTSNSRTRLDASFSRRLEMILEFSPPDPTQRRLLWHSHLGDNHQLTAADINLLAVTADLTGGEIRNAVLAAAVQAASRKTHIEFTDVLFGLYGEYRKLGRHMPDGLMLMMNEKKSS
jgi:ATPase family associated with various cellular activities (AAA)